MARAYKKNPEKWGAIRKLKSGRRQASYVGPDGVRYNAPTTFDALADARAWLDERRREIQRGEWVDPGTRAVRAEEAVKVADAEVFEVYAATWVAQRVSGKGQPLRPKTRTEYERQLSKGLSEFRSDRLSTITPARVRSWHASRMAVGPTAAGAEARLLRAILNTAVADGIISRNPVDTNLTRTKTGIKHRPPTLDELAILLDTIDPAFRLAVLLGAYGGLRLSEWRALCRKDITLSPVLTVNVERAAQYITGLGWHVGPPKSEEGVRVTTLPSGLTGEVQRHLDERVGEFPDSLVFQPKGRSEFIHDRQFADAWNVARDAAGVRRKIVDPTTGRITHETVVREHDLRAFAGTMHAQAGATYRETMALLGHSTMAAALAYQATTGRDAELAERMPLPVASTKRRADLRSISRD